VPGLVLEVVMVCIGIVLVEPDAIKPVIPGVAVADQVKVVPTRLAVRFTAVVGVPEHIVWLRFVLVMVGASFTVKF